MLDQASDLRHFVIHRAHTTDPDDSPKLIVVSGGERAVGATTVAVNLAIGLARDGRRTALIDAAASGDVASQCGLTDASSVSDVLDETRNLHEALQLGPNGILVIGGAGRERSMHDMSEADQDRLIAQLRGLAPHLDYVVLDVGSGASAAQDRFWRAAESVLIVTSPATSAIMESYSVVKQLSAEAARTRLVSLVNKAPNALAAADVHERLARACRRFLGIDVARGGWIPDDAMLAESDVAGRTATSDHSSDVVARHIELLVETLVSSANRTTRVPLAAAS